MRVSVIDLLGHDPQRRPDGDDQLLRVAAGALDERPQVAGAGDGRPRPRADRSASRWRSRTGRARCRRDASFSSAQHGARAPRRARGAAASPSASATPARPRWARCRNVRHQHRDLAVAVLDDLEEVAPVTAGARCRVAMRSWLQVGKCTKCGPRRRADPTAAPVLSALVLMVALSDYDGSRHF